MPTLQVLLAAVLIVLRATGSASAAAQVELPEAPPHGPIVISAEAANRWQQGACEAWVLRGNCSISQGGSSARGQEAVVWITHADNPEHRPATVIAYLEGDVVVESGIKGSGVLNSVMCRADDPRPIKDSRPLYSARLEDRTWLGRFGTGGEVQVRVPRVADKPSVLPAIYQRGLARLDPGPKGTVPFASDENRYSPRPVVQALAEPVAPDRQAPAEPVAPNRQAPAEPVAPNSTVVQAQFIQPQPPAAAPLAPVAAPVAGAPPAAGAPLIPVAAPAVVPVPPSTRRIYAYARSNVDVEARIDHPQPDMSIIQITSGVQLIIEGLNQSVTGVGIIDKIEVVTDRMVIWTRGPEPDLKGQTPQDARLPLEIYMEGNIVFRQGERTIYAERMYYDVTNKVGTVLKADMLTPVPKYEGLLRLHAEVIQQTGPDRYFAQDAFLTSSRMGQPGYRLQAGDVEFEDLQLAAVDPISGQPVVDARTGQPVYNHERLATSTNNFLFLGPVPVFYWPVLKTDLTESTYYLRRAQLKNDSVFGVQVLTDFNVYELLGIGRSLRPAGTNWDLSLDYLSLRGFGYGSAFTYHRDDLFGIGGTAAGLLDAWAIQDSGKDNLGSDRRAVNPEKDYRYRVFGQHRQQFGDGFQLSAEVGWISDRNFLEQYYKQEWDELKDESTGVELKQTRGNMSWSITADARLNDFFTETQWLPRGDHFLIGQPLFGDVFTWYEHSSAAYAQFQRAAPPALPPVGNETTFSYLPWEQASRASGGRFATRQELDWPFQMGAVKIVPFVLGEAAHWDQDINGNPLDRLYGEAGIRASVPMWSVDPTIESGLWNVHGLAHKIVFDAQFSVADANRDMTLLPLYDPLDDNSIEAFRRRFVTNTYGIPSTFPPTPTVITTKQLQPFDERFYALRTGIADWVTAPSTEVVDDLTAIRLGMHNRWQTKRGNPDDRHIIDWITLDTDVTFYPDATRDNFGTALGLADYDFRWHVGDRLTLVSDGIFDFFSQGQKVASVGAFLTRPPRGSLYMGFRVLEGPIDEKILAVSYSYWMSPKWTSTMGFTVDLGRDGNLGENFSITRVGESLLISAGFTVDPARNNVGVGLVVEPRFLPKSRLGTTGGVNIPTAGAYGLE